MITPIDKILLNLSKKIKEIDLLIEIVKSTRPKNERFVKEYLKKLETEKEILLKNISDIIEDEGDKEEL